jgi:hypothetical protein
MRLRLRDKYDQAKWTTLWLHSPVELPLRASIHACPGEVILRDRTDKQVNFFVLATLQAILTRYERDHHTLQETFHEFYLTLRNGKQWLIESGQWPASPPKLEELLAPN